MLIRTVPIEECFREDGEWCILRFDDDVATLSGTVRDTRCIEPIPRTAVRLEDLDREPGSPVIYRDAYANWEGRYRISAIEPGKRYLLVVKRALHEDELRGDSPHVPLFTVHADTVVFEPGEHRVYDVGLERLEPCPGRM